MTPFLDDPYARYELRIWKTPNLSYLKPKPISRTNDVALAMSEAGERREVFGCHVLDTKTGWTFYPLAGWISPDGLNRTRSYSPPR